MPPSGFYYTVKHGDTLSSIAQRNGIDDWNVIYNDPKNDSFRKNRPDPNKIHPGDVLWIPVGKPKSATGKSGTPLGVVKKSLKPVFILEIVDENDAPVTINTKIVVTFSDLHKVTLITTGGSTRIDLHLAGKLEVLFVDGWVLKDKKATFWRKWDGADVKNGDTIRLKVLFLAEGDILLREGGEDDSILIMKISGHPYSHAGMVVREGGSLKAIDAYPGRDPYAIGTVTVEDFFSPAHAKTGIIVRYKSGKEIPEKAANWGLSQTRVKYTFDIMDEFSNDNNSLYCSEFVWRCYDSQGEDLVPEPINFLTPDKKENTINALIDYAYTSGEAPGYAPRWKVRPSVEEYIEDHSGKFVAPYQLAESEKVRKVCNVAPSDSSATGSGSSAPKKV